MEKHKFSGVMVMMELYSYFRSSSSYRVRIALNLKGLEYQIRPVHLLRQGGEQFTESFKKLNPGCRIPVLVHNSHNISQSTAIIEYLEEKFPEPALYPKAPLERAKVRQLCEIINSDIQPLQNLSLLKKLVKEYSLSEEQKLNWIRHWIKLGFQSFETLIGQERGSFSLYHEPCAVDCFLIPQVYNALRFKVDLSEFPKIQKAHKQAEKLSAFKKAHPDNQPDTPR